MSVSEPLTQLPSKPSVPPASSDVPNGAPDDAPRSLLAELGEMIRELVQYRELLWQMVLRDIRIRYKQAVMGFGWAIFMPMMLVAAGCLVKYALAQAAHDPLSVPRLAGMSVKALGWAFFTGAVGFAANSLVSNMALVTKVYFPRETFPLSAVLTQAFDTLIGGCVLAVFLVIFAGVALGPVLLWVPLLLVLLIFMTAAAALVLSCANVFFRDVKYIVQVLLTFGVFFTPVFYEPQLFGPVGAELMMLNPLAPLLEGLRLTIIDNHNLWEPLYYLPAEGPAVLVWQPWYLAYAAFWSIAGFFLAWRTFHRLEFAYAEYI